MDQSELSYYTFNLNEHSVVLNKDKSSTYICSICTCSYSYEHSLRRHVLRSHINRAYIATKDLAVFSTYFSIVIIVSCSHIYCELNNTLARFLYPVVMTTSFNIMVVVFLLIRIGIPVDSTRFMGVMEASKPVATKSNGKGFTFVYMM